MHGLTGGNWKRSRHRATATEKNGTAGNRAVTKAPCPTADRRDRASSRPSYFVIMAGVAGNRTAAA